MVVVAIPTEEVWVVTVLQDELLAAEVGVAEADPGAALHTDGVHPVHEASVLEVLTVPEDLQLPPREVLALVQRDLGGPGQGGAGSRLLSALFQGQTSGAPTPSTEPRLPGSLKPRPAAHSWCPSPSADDGVSRCPALPAPGDRWSRQIPEETWAQGSPLSRGSCENRLLSNSHCRFETRFWSVVKT